VEPESPDKQQVKVTILNQSFTLLTSGDPKEMIELAQHVDDLMDSIARQSPNLDSTRVAVFACLHLADQIRSQQSEVNLKIKECAGLLEKVLE